MPPSTPVRVVDKNYSAMVTDSGEIWTTVTERENDVFSVYQAVFNATVYIILISLLNPNFPHVLQKQSTSRLDITSLYFAIDLAANSEGAISIGVITRIDGVNADIKNIFGIPFLSGAAKEVIIDSLRGTPSQVKLDFNANGVLQHGVSNIEETDVAAVNTGITLNSPIGLISPGLGDMIIKYTHSSGSSNIGLFAFYHAH